MTTEDRPAGVPAEATQAGEFRARWAWTEPTVWTDRMLEALERGVKGGHWYSLMDKVYRRENLKAGFAEVEANRGKPGVDHVTVEQFAQQREEQVERLSTDLRQGTYRPAAIRRTYIPKPGSAEPRPLGIPTVRDRTVQAALRHVLEPIFERTFAERSYGFRPGRGAKDALREVDRLLKNGKLYVVDADLKSYFDSIPHERLIERVKEQVADGRVLELVKSFLKQGVMEGGRIAEAAEEGTPQGGVISPLLANVYLNPLDHLMGQRGYAMVRYADDLVILCASQAEADAALAELRAWTEREGLTLHPTKTRIVDMNEAGAGFDFLGYHFTRTQRGRLTRWPRSKSLGKFKDTIRQITRRTNGHSLPQIIQRTNRSARGWFEYFKHSHHTTFGPLDSWVRQRLRSILRKRSRRRGRARGLDHQRWPNAYFAGQGLFSMIQAHARALQSVAR